MTVAAPGLLGRIRALVAAAARVYEGGPHAGAVTDIARRIDEPLRVAIAGRVKAGKSTLLNALIGQELAATDAGECTRIVTWFRDGLSYRVTLEPHTGPARELPFGGSGSLADIDLTGYPPESVRRLVVDWPSQQLRAMTFIDTPGIGSLDAAAGERAREILAPATGQGPDADAVIYLMRHMHGDDMQFLESFVDTPGQATPVNTVGVLSRADEVGHARADALDSAQRIAARYQNDPRIRRLCHSVLPVAGLLACAATTLRENEYHRLRQLATLPEPQRERLLLSTDRFLAEHPLPAEFSLVLAPRARAELLTRAGLFGIRHSVALITTGQVHTATELSYQLLRLSGIDELRQLLSRQFTVRAQVLKARTALLALEEVFRAGPPPEELLRHREQVWAGAHELTEIRLIDALREGPTLFPPAEVESAERLLGANGSDVRSRLGLTPASTPVQLRAAIFAELGRWQREAEDPVSTRAATAAARILVRTCEGMLATTGHSERG